MQLAREMFNLSRQRIILWSLANTIQVGQPQGNQPPTSTPTGGHSTRRKERIADGFSWLISLKVPLDALSMLSVLDRSETISMSATVMLIYRAKSLFNFCGVMSSICHPWYTKSQLRSFGRVSFWKQSSVVKCFWPSRNENLLAMRCP